MSDRLTDEHIRKLYQIQEARIKRGLPGIGDEMDKLIQKLMVDEFNKGPNDLRTQQARCLWELGAVRSLSYRRFNSYLESIPEIPETLLDEDEKFPLLALDDPRPSRTLRVERVGITYRGLTYKYDNESFVPRDELHAVPKEPYWFRANYGWKNRGREPKECLKECVGNILAGTADAGIALYVHYKKNLRLECHAMLLPGSVERADVKNCAWLGIWQANSTIRLTSAMYSRPEAGVGVVTFRMK